MLDNLFQTPSSVPKKRKRDSSCSSSSETPAALRDRIEGILNKERVGKVLRIKDLPKYLTINPSSPEIEKEREAFKTRCDESFLTISRNGWDTEEELQKLFVQLLTNAFSGHKELDFFDTHKKGMTYHPSGGEEFPRLPDVTICHKMQPFSVFGRLFFELKKDFQKRFNMDYICGFGQLQKIANELFFNNYGVIVPRENVLGITSDGQSFYFYIFIVANDNISTRHYEFKIPNVSALDFLFDIIHRHSFQPYKMEVSLINEAGIINLFEDEFEIDCKIIHQTSLSYVFGLMSHVLKINANPQYHQAITGEAQVYKLIRETSRENLPILNLIGRYDYDEARKKCALLFEEKGQNLNSVQGIAHPWDDIVKFLKLLHATNYVHRDIRPENFLRVDRNGEEKILIIDFGFSCEKGKKNYYSGAWQTASDKVLVDLQHTDDVAVTPEDDLESLVKSVVLLTFNSNLFTESLRKLKPKLKEERREASKNIKHEWDLIKDTFIVKHIFKDCWLHAKNCDYEKLITELKKTEVLLH